jgi:hypothetical protein
MNDEYTIEIPLEGTGEILIVEVFNFVLSYSLKSREDSLGFHSIEETIEFAYPLNDPIKQMERLSQVSSSIADEMKARNLK